MDSKQKACFEKQNKVPINTHTGTCECMPEQQRYRRPIFSECAQSRCQYRRAPLAGGTAPVLALLMIMRVQ